MLEYEGHSYTVILEYEGPSFKQKWNANMKVTFIRSWKVPIRDNTKVTIFNWYKKLEDTYGVIRNSKSKIPMV